MPSKSHGWWSAASHNTTREEEHCRTRLQRGLVAESSLYLPRTLSIWVRRPMSEVIVLCVATDNGQPLLRHRHKSGKDSPSDADDALVELVPAERVRGDEDIKRVLDELKLDRLLLPVHMRRLISLCAE